MANDFVVNDSGKRVEYASGMRRDITTGKMNWMLIRPGPMLHRWADHLTKAVVKYDGTRKPGEPRNWELANSAEELERFQESAARHFEQWLAGDQDGQDHAASVFFNINAYEHVKAKLSRDTVVKGARIFTESPALRDQVKSAAPTPQSLRAESPIEGSYPLGDL